MDDTLMLFVIIAAVALALQALMQLAVGIFLITKAAHIQEMLKEPRDKVNALLASFQRITSDVEPRISRFTGNAVQISEMARAQADRVNDATTEVVDRLRAQVVHTDRVLTSAIDSIESAGSEFRHQILRPVNVVRALKRGLQVGFGVYRSKAGERHRPNGHAEMDLEDRYGDHRS